MSDRRFQRDPSRPCYVISVAASLVEVHPRTLRIYEDEGLLSPARTPTNIRLYSENDIRRILWIRRLTQERGVNLAGVRLLFDLEERLGTRILEALFDDSKAREAAAVAAAAQAAGPDERETVNPAAVDHGEVGGSNGHAKAHPDETFEETYGRGVNQPANPDRQSQHITRIVATRATPRVTSGDSND